MTQPCWGVWRAIGDADCSRLRTQGSAHPSTPPPRRLTPLRPGLRPPARRARRARPAHLERVVDRLLQLVAVLCDRLLRHQVAQRVGVAHARREFHQLLRSSAGAHAARGQAGGREGGWLGTPVHALGERGTCGLPQWAHAPARMRCGASRGARPSCLRVLPRDLVALPKQQLQHQGVARRDRLRHVVAAPVVDRGALGHWVDELLTGGGAGGGARQGALRRGFAVVVGGGDGWWWQWWCVVVSGRPDWLRQALVEGPG